MNKDGAIIDMYKNNMSAADIAKKLNKHITTIFRILKRNNISVRSNKLSFSKNNVPKEIGSQIISLYSSGFSANKIAKKLNIYHTFILYFLKKNNISIIPAHISARKYNINESFFDNIDTEAKSYFLGLLFADGCNSLKYRRVSISLQEEDCDILDLFKTHIGSNVPLEFLKRKDSKHKNQYRLSISNKKLTEQLNSLGCVPRKSLILVFPNYLQDEVNTRHFIRGYFDGDGSLNKCLKKGKNTPTFYWSLTSTKDFCDNVGNILRNVIGTNSYLTKTHNNITYVLSSGGNLQIQKIMDWLYKDATIFLKRKYKIYLDLLNVNSRENYR